MLTSQRPTYPQHILSKSPTAYYQLNDTGSTLVDQGSAAKNGTFVGSVTKSIRCPADNGRSRGIHLANGGSAYGQIASITSGTALDIRANAWTVTAMVRTTAFNSDFNILGRTTGGTAQVGLVGTSASARPYVARYGAGVTTATSGITDCHRWHHIVWVSTDDLSQTSEVRMYLDGVLLTNGSFTSGSAATGGGGDFRIGEGFAGTGCFVSEVAIFPTAFTTQEVADLYAAAQIRYETRYKPKVGLHQDLDYDGSYATLAANAGLDGAKISRSTVEWSEVEPTEGASKDWSTVDAFLTEVADAGMEPLLVVATSPTWANGGSTVHDIPTSGGAFTTFVGKYTTWITALVNRYKTASGGRPRVAKWEIWNEPNLVGFWNPTPSAAQYVELANAARTAILAADSTAEIAVGALGSVGAGAGGSNITGKTFLQSAITAGLSSSFSIYSLHPYHLTAESPYLHTDFGNNLDDIRAVLDVLEFNGRLTDATKLWLTEWGGWDTGTVSQANQALWVTQCMAIVRDTYAGHVELMCHFSDADDAGGKAGTGIRLGSGSSYAAKIVRAPFLAYASD